MSQTTYKLFWSASAKEDLKTIYNFIKQKSVKGAKHVIADIRKAPKSVYFPEQHQVEDYLPVCRRLVVRNYKILYTIDAIKKELFVVRVFDTRQHPETM